MKVNSLSNKKEIFSKLRDHIFLNAHSEKMSEIKISSLENHEVIGELKTLKIIELDNLESFLDYVNYDHFLIFKFEDNYYFCDTEMVSQLGMHSISKIIDFNQHLRKDKLEKIRNK